MICEYITNLLNKVVENMFTGLWVDDSPSMPSSLAKDGWTHARSVWEALLKLDLIEFEKISINSKMKSNVGYNCLYACDIIDWLDDRFKDNLHIPKNILVHETKNCENCTKNCLIKK